MFECGLLSCTIDALKEERDLTWSERDFCVQRYARCCPYSRASRLRPSRRNSSPRHIPRLSAGRPIRRSGTARCYFLRPTPDLLVSAFFDQRLREPVLAVPLRGGLNVHPSLLPHFKGVDPVLQAKLQAAPQGVSVHYMTPVLDSGAVLRQRSVAGSDRESVFALTARLYRQGVELLVGALDDLARGQAGAVQTEPGSYQSWPSRTDLEALRRSGGRLIRLADLAGILTA